MEALKFIDADRLKSITEIKVALLKAAISMSSIISTCIENNSSIEESLFTYAQELESRNKIIRASFPELHTDERILNLINNYYEKEKSRILSISRLLLDEKDVTIDFFHSQCIGTNIPISATQCVILYDIFAFSEIFGVYLKSNDPWLKSLEGSQDDK